MDFRAIVLAELDTSQAQSQLNSFISQAQGTPITIPVNMNGIQQQGTVTGNTFAKAFNNAFNGSNIDFSNAQNNQFRIYMRNAQQQQRQFVNSLNTTKISTFDNQMTAWARSNSKAMNAMMSSTAGTYGEALADYHRQIHDLQNDIATGGGVITRSHVAQFNEIRDGFRNLQSEARATGNVGKSLGDQFTSALGGVARFAASYVGIRQVFNTIKDGIRTVNELDDALVDLQKTTTATPQQLNTFYKEANDIAKQYGTTTRQVIQGAADWSRLGYSLEDSKAMSKLSSQFASISPGVSVDEATSGLVSSMKAFGISTDDALDGVMSKINIVGNNFAVSNKDIIEGLRRTSAAMSAMGQDIDSTIALFTAANEILQDSALTGTALKSMSLRIRGFDEETEVLSDDLVGITGKIIDLTKTAKKPMGVSLFTDASQTQYKDFVDYFRELSEVWDDMSAKNQTALLNNLFGKRGAQAGSAIIKNFDQVDAALQKMSNSAGNADAEMGIITQSISYKLNALKETGTGIFQNLFQRDDMGVVIDTLTGFLGIIDSITDKLGLVGSVLVGGGLAVGIMNVA